MIVKLRRWFVCSSIPAHLTVLRPGQFTDGPVRAEHAPPRAEHRQAVGHVRPGYNRVLHKNLCDRDMGFN